MMRTLIDRRLWVGGAAACLTWIAATKLGVGAVWFSTALVFVATVFLYSLDDLFDEPSKRRTTLAAVASAGTVLVAMLATAPFTLQLTVVLGLAGCALYGAPLLCWRGRRVGLKAIPGVKAPLVALSLTTAMLTVPVLADEAALQLAQMAPIALCLFVLTLGNALLFDICDAAEDRKRAVPTLPVLIGVARTRALIVAFHVVAIAALFWRRQSELAVVLVASLGVVLITQSERRTTELLADGLPYAVALVVSIL